MSYAKDSSRLANAPSLGDSEIANDRLFRVVSHRASRPSGVILVLVLMLLALSAAIVAHISYRVVRLMSNAVEAQSELQERWAMTTIRRSYLTAASKQFDRIAESKNSSSTLSGHLFLGNVRYDLVLRDESAKLPAHSLAGSINHERLRPVLGSLMTEAGVLRNTFPRRLERWSHLIQSETVANSRERWLLLQSNTDNLTLWSDGRLNVRRCSTQVLDAMWRSHFGKQAPEALHSARNSGKRVEAAELIRKAGLREKEAEVSRSWVATDSNTFSLWISPIRAGENGTTAIYVKQSFSRYAENHFGYFDP